MARTSRYAIAGILAIALGIGIWHLNGKPFSLQGLGLSRPQDSFKQSEPTQEPQNFETTQGWVANVKGVVQGVSKTDVDKSGRHPKYIYFITVLKEDSICNSCAFELEQEIKFRVKEKHLLESIGREIKRGDRVEVQTSGIGQMPRIFRTVSIKLSE
jgi:hypothetical protein